jgi:hypothetical protein
MNRLVGLLALVATALLAALVVAQLTAPTVHIVPDPDEAKLARTSTPDAGSLDSIVDSVQLEHSIKHGR